MGAMGAMGAMGGMGGMGGMGENARESSLGYFCDFFACS